MLSIILGAAMFLVSTTTYSYIIFRWPSVLVILIYNQVSYFPPLPSCSSLCLFILQVIGERIVWHYMVSVSVFSSSLNYFSGVSRVSAEYMEGLCTQLRESETSRWQLLDQCTRLEKLVKVLRKKVNGLGILESGVRTEGTKLTLVDLTLHGPATESPPGSGHHHLPASTSSEGEPKDSLSSLESVETASASSWRRGEVPSITSHSNTNLHSSYISQHSSSPHATLNTHLNNHTNLLHSSQTQSNHIQSGQVNSCHSSSSLSPPSSHSPHTSPHHRQQGTSSASDRDAKYIPGVTIVGPITEL